MLLLRVSPLIELEASLRQGCMVPPTYKFFIVYEMSMFINNVVEALPLIVMVS